MQTIQCVSPSLFHIHALCNLPFEPFLLVVLDRNLFHRTFRTIVTSPNGFLAGDFIRDPFAVYRDFFWLFQVHITEIVLLSSRHTEILF